MKITTRRKKKRYVCASELAQMGVCERFVVFEHRYGKRTTIVQRAAIRRGLQAHERFYREGRRTSGKRGRCYIATLAFGAGPETAALRMFRDRVLRPRAVGRWLIWVYYKTGPRICVVLERWRWLQPLVRTLLRPLAWGVGHLLRGDEGDHVA